MAKQTKQATEKKQRSEELDRAADTYEDLVVGADSTENVVLLSPFQPQTILLMISNRKYAEQVKRRHKKRYPTGE